jgi:hypothetical protein
MTKQIRQGDVYLEWIGEVVPEGAVKQKNKGRIVLAWGEVTGHAHAIATKHATRYEWEGNTLVEIKVTSKLVHEEHSAITLEPGVWQKTQQRQYTPEGIRNVTD